MTNVNVAASEKGLRQHIRMKHKPKDSQLEVLRSSHEGTLDTSISPLLDASREEPSHNSEAEEVVMTGDGGRKLSPTLNYTCVNCDDRMIQSYDSWCCEVTKKLCRDCCDVLGVCPIVYPTVATK